MVYICVGWYFSSACIPRREKLSYAQIQEFKRTHEVKTTGYVKVDFGDIIILESEDALIHLDRMR
jgi:hypothetical protein